MPESSPHKCLQHIWSTTTSIPCVFVEQQAPDNRSNSRLHSRIDISLLLCSQLPPKSFNDRDMPESSPHRYPTHILSHNHQHTMCICEGIGTRQPLRLTFIHTVSTFHCFYSLNFHQSPSMIEICRNQVHTNASKIFCLTATSIPCVFVKQQALSNSQLYSRTRYFTACMLSTSAKVLQ